MTFSSLRLAPPLAVIGLGLTLLSTPPGPPRRTGSCCRR